jgi:hypothetical protein
VELCLGSVLAWHKEEESSREILRSSASNFHSSSSRSMGRALLPRAVLITPQALLDSARTLPSRHRRSRAWSRTSSTRHAPTTQVLCRWRPRLGKEVASPRSSCLRLATLSAVEGELERCRHDVRSSTISNNNFYLLFL